MTQVLHVDSLGEYLDVIAAIQDGKQGALWFRGESDFVFTLTPSIFRENQALITRSSREQYSNLHYAESIRIQHYNAKNYHYLDKEPTSRIEWLEMMQHHGVYTRTLDWSESSIHSLLFALEPFYNSEKKADRSIRTPCVWILQPQKMNKDLLQELGKNSSLQGDLLRILKLNKTDERDLINRMKGLSNANNLKKYMEQDIIGHLDYLVNLSAIDDEISKVGAQLGSLLVNKESFNPLFYLLHRIYSDGYILKDYKLPPLAVVHPYHSDRIKAQHGVFTVSPFYKVLDEQQHAYLKSLNINPDSMAFNTLAKKYLCKVLLRRPQKIARELLANGMCESWLYPEMPITCSEIEHHGVW